MSSHEGDRSPWKERAIRCPQGCRYAIRTPLSEQRLEADGSTRKGGAQRHGGTGRGDTVQPEAGGTLRRVEMTSRGRGLPHPGPKERPPGRPDGSRKRPAKAEGAGFEKRGEPQGRQWDATSPRSFARRKPSRWCETTRAERELDGWCRRPEGRPGATRIGWEWTRRGCVGGGAARSRTPREDGSRSRTELRLRTDREGPGRVRTLRRRRKIWSADEGWLATRKRAPGEVLEGPGLVTAEGRGGQQQRTNRAAHRGRRGFIRVVRRNSRRARRRHRSAPLRRPRKIT
jgi:hypothetical protein